MINEMNFGDLSSVVGAACALGGIYYLFKSLSFGFRTEDKYFEYVTDPITRRRPVRSTFDLTVPDITVDEASYESFLEDQFIDATSRAGFTNADFEDGVVYRGRGDWNRTSSDWVY